jgi:hypothetical protein
MSNEILKANTFDLTLKQITDKAVRDGVGRRTIMRLLDRPRFRGHSMCRLAKPARAHP